MKFGEFKKQIMGMVIEIEGRVDVVADNKLQCRMMAESMLNGMGNLQDDSNVEYNKAKANQDKFARQYASFKQGVNSCLGHPSHDMFEALDKALATPSALVNNAPARASSSKILKRFSSNSSVNDVKVQSPELPVSAVGKLYDAIREEFSLEFLRGIKKSSRLSGGKVIKYGNEEIRISTDLAKIVGLFNQPTKNVDPALQGSTLGDIFAISKRWLEKKAPERVHQIQFETKSADDRADKIIYFRSDPRLKPNPEHLMHAALYQLLQPVCDPAFAGLASKMGVDFVDFKVKKFIEVINPAKFINQQIKNQQIKNQDDPISSRPSNRGPK